MKIVSKTHCGLMVVIITLSLASSATAETALDSPGGHFEIHVDPWISLHHFAYHFVRNETSDLKLRGRVRLTDDDKAAFSPEFRSACASLTTAYQPYIEGDLLFDAKTRSISRTLTAGVDNVSDGDLREALKLCMPAYETLLWPRHRAASEGLRKRLLQQLESYENKMAQAYADALEVSWPDEAIRVDISAYANWAGAYTDESPAHITLSSLDEGVAGEHAFEILFHESAHTSAFGQAILAAANNALQVSGLESDRYWHYVLFFLSGRTTGKVLGDPNYIPFAAAAGLTRRKSAIEYYSALDETWGCGGSFEERVVRAAQKVARERN